MLLVAVLSCRLTLVGKLLWIHSLSAYVDWWEPSLNATCSLPNRLSSASDFYYCSEVPTEASSPTLSFIVPAHRTLDVGSVQWIRCIVAHLPDVIYTIPQYLDFQIYSNSIERTLIVTEKYSCISCTITRFISSYLEFNSG